MGLDDAIGKSNELAAVSFLPAGVKDVKAMTSDEPFYEKGSEVFNGVLVPPLDSDYLQYTPNNKLLQFLKISMSEQDKSSLSYEQARLRAMALYTESLRNVNENSYATSNDNSLMVVTSMVDEYKGMISEQEFKEIPIGLSELTSEQLLRLVNEHAETIKISANDRFQRWGAAFCIFTTAITLVSLITGPGSIPVAVGKKVGTTALSKFLKFVAVKISVFYASTLGRAILIGEVAGDALITYQELMNVANEAIDPSIRADKTGWEYVSKSMVSNLPHYEKYSYKYIMKPSEMLALLAIWERGDRAVLDIRLRNLIYGKSARFKTDASTFARIKYRINRIGNGVERQLGTPSLFPAFSLALRIFARMTAKRGIPVLGTILSAGMWFSRVQQYDDTQRR